MEYDYSCILFKYYSFFFFYLDMFLVLVFRLLGARKVLEGTRGMIVLFSYFFNGYTDGRLLKENLHL